MTIENIAGRKAAAAARAYLLVISCESGDADMHSGDFAPLTKFQN